MEQLPRLKARIASLNELRDHTFAVRDAKLLQGGVEGPGAVAGSEVFPETREDIVRARKV